MVIKVKTRYGPIDMGINKNVEAEHANFKFEKKFIEILETEDYDFFIDVGAAWGYHTVPAANHTDKVYSFEPSAKRFTLLDQNIDNLELRNVVVSTRAVGTGKMHLFSGGSMYGPQTGLRGTPENVDWIPLEVVAKPHITRGEKGIIKIDVEGNELDVIESAGNLELYKNCIWLIEKHEKEGLGYNEEALLNAMQPFVGKLVGVRKWTSHYVFRWRQG